METPARFVDWINKNLRFNPRAGKYSVALSQLVVDDLSKQASEIAGALQRRTLIPQTDADVSTWGKRNVDLVIWETNPEFEPTAAAGERRKVAIAVENKLILAAHGKARKNRLGDIVAFANHIHNANPQAVAGGLIVVNISPAYANPDPFAEGMERRQFPMEKVVRDTIAIYAGLPQRNAATDPSDLPEAFGVFVINYDGESPAKLVTEPPAPHPGDPVHFHTFIERLARLYEQRRTTT